MHIIIPMSGAGNRFLAAGYKEPKPLIPVDGRPIIEYVIGLFPGETKFTFICNQDHLDHSPLKSVLQKAAPQGNIVAISSHKKGPVFAVSQIFNLIGDNEEVIVNYCDFACDWDYQNFLHTLRTNKADGGIAAYRGFHPHMLGLTNYAFIKDKNNWLLEIKEKEPFTDNRMNEFASSGTYYFRQGKLVKKYFQQLMDQDINLNGEYYVSLVYNLLFQDGFKTYTYEINHMLQWGEPNDLKEYQKWSNYFSEMIKPQTKVSLGKNSITLIPMAGAGKRFSDEGYKNPKPLIEISGEPMFLQATRYLPVSQKQIFVCLGEHLKNYPLENSIKNFYPNAKIISLDHLTQGQACSCELGLKDENLEAPLLIASCDNGMLWDHKKFQKLIDSPNVDAIAWTFRGHSHSALNPQMYGWIKIDNNDTATNVSVKKQISETPINDHAITGAFYFRKTEFFIQALESLYKQNLRVNNEFYVDSCIGELVKMNKHVKVFEVSLYIGWGTPNDLRTYEYWQKFFHQCSWHPYKTQSDPTVNQEKMNLLKN